MSAVLPVEAGEVGMANKGVVGVDDPGEMDPVGFGLEFRSDFFEDGEGGGNEADGKGFGGGN